VFGLLGRETGDAFDLVELLGQLVDETFEVLDPADDVVEGMGPPLSVRPLMLDVELGEDVGPSEVDVWCRLRRPVRIGCEHLTFLAGRIAVDES
jgi:hypothetical protein